MEVRIILTASKLLAFTIVGIGAVYAFINKDGNVLMSSFTASGIVVAVKTYTGKNKGNEGNS